MSKKITGFSLDEEVVEGVRSLAKREQRTLSNYVNMLLAEHLEEVGYKATIKTKQKKKLNRRKT